MEKRKGIIKMDKKIKPCPLCGGEMLINCKEKEGGENLYALECDCCYLVYGVTSLDKDYEPCYTSEDKMIEKWNEYSENIKKR